MKKQLIINTLITIILGIIAWKTSSGWLEIAGSITGLLSVWLFAKESMWNYPFSYANCILWFWMFWQDKLFGDATLQILFLVLTAYGNFAWLKNKGHNNVRKTTNIRLIEIVISIAIVVFGTWGFGHYLVTVKDIAPYTDAFITSGSVVSQYFLSRKIYENWYMWILLDVIQIGLYTIKHLDVTAFTYLVFLIIAIGGAFGWKRVMKIERSA